MTDFLKNLPKADPCEILTYPHPSLRVVADEVAPHEMEEIRAQLPAMFAAMYEAPGIGLAATQVGIHKRFFIMDLAGEDEEPTPRVFINPEIIAEDEEYDAERQEGCLSLPNVYAEVTRPATVTLRYQDLDGQVHIETADDLKAACFQHETDHLNGVLFVDYLSKTKRDMLLKKLAKFLKQRRR